MGTKMARVRRRGSREAEVGSPGPKVELVEEGRGGLCRQVLESLPEHFGIPEAVEGYVRAVEDLPVYAVRSGGDRVGLVALKEQSERTTEVFVMGILPTHQRGGLGARLVRAAERHARERGMKLLSVKTLSPARENEEYARTRAFYRAMGFFPVEEFSTLWGEGNPCLLMAKIL